MQTRSKTKTVAPAVPVVAKATKKKAVVPAKAVPVPRPKGPKSKPKAPAQPTKEEVNEAVPENTDPPTSNPRTESGQEEVISE